MKESFFKYFINTILFICVWIVSYWIVNISVYDPIFESLALTIILIFLYKKVEKKYL